MSIDKEKSKKNKKATGFKGILAKGFVILFIGGTLIIGPTHYAYKHIPKSESYLISRVEQTQDRLFNTSLEEGQLVPIYALEADMLMDKTLAELSLDKESKDLKPIDTTYYSKEDIAALIIEFESLKDIDKNTPSKNSLRYYEIAAILKDYNERFNACASKETLDCINNTTELLIKSLVVEGLQLDSSCREYMKTNLTELDKEFIVTYTDPTTGKVFELTMSNFNNLNVLIKRVRELNDLLTVKKDKNGNVIEISEKDILAKQSEVIKTLKYALEINCSINNGVIGEEGNLFQVVSQKIKYN